jgi:pimeloyl-ACP methyl ester carboxylesterase
MKKLILVFCVLPLFAAGQEIDNLQLPPGYPVAVQGQLDNIKVFKSKARRALIIVAGWGLDDRHYTAFARRCVDKFEVHIVNIPGYRNTAVPPLPHNSYGAQTWTNAIVDGLHEYIVNNKIKKPLIAGHLLSSTQVAARMGLRYPEIVGGIIILGGPAVLQFPGMPAVTVEKRIQAQDTYWAPKWFKTVSRQTWDAGNYPSWFYAMDSTTGKNIFDDVQANSIPVMIQYLEEFSAQDTEQELADLKVKMLVLLPDFAGAPQTPVMSGVQLSFIDPWKRLALKNQNIFLQDVSNSRSCATTDQPEAVMAAIERFFPR